MTIKVNGLKYHLKRKYRLVVFSDANGTTTARQTDQYNHDSWQVEKYNLTTRGFTELASFTIPTKAIIGRGWYPIYQYYLNWAVRNMGI
jgi:hypothetical protein